MQYYVLDTSYNWADEMDIDRYTIVSEKELNDYKKDLAKVPDSYEYSTYIGSNEEQIFTKDDIEYMLKSAERISESDMKVLQKYVSHCSEDPICDFLEAYYEEHRDEENSDEDEESDEESDEEFDEDNSDYTETDNEIKPYEVDPDLPDGEVKVLSDIPEKYNLTEGTILYGCYLYGKPWFEYWLTDTDGKEGWYKSFKSTVHWDINGWFVYPNDDPTREKYYKFGAGSETCIKPTV